MVGYFEIAIILGFALFTAYITGYLAGGMLSTPVQTIIQGINVSFSRIFSSLIQAKSALVQRSMGNIFLTLWLVLPALTMSVGVAFFFQRSFNMSFLWTLFLFSIIFVVGGIIAMGMGAFTSTYLPTMPEVPAINNTSVINQTVTNQSGGLMLV